jgi:proline-specific peptidase
MMLPAREGTIPFHGYRTWYRIVGDGEEPGKFPLLALHGGPGATHDYLEPLEALAATGRRVIFYDQLGCGNSDQPHDPLLWTIPLFVAEVDAIRTALGLDRMHLLGQSWGGQLALEYLLTRPAGVVSLTLASSLASAQRWEDEATRLRAELPLDVRQVLAAHEAAGTVADPAYQAASTEYYKRHVCRIYPWPACVQSAFDKMAANSEVYNTMWGPTEFALTGTLRGWSVEERLGELALPTLLTSGRYDESTPAINEVMQRGIAGSTWTIFAQSAHMAHVEETEAYLRLLGDFLARVEAA